MFKNNCKKKAKHASPTLDAKKNLCNRTMHVSAFGLISWPLLFAQADKLAQEAVTDVASSALNQLHESILTPLLRNDSISQQVTLQRITEDSRIISASLNGVDGELFSSEHQL